MIEVAIIWGSLCMKAKLACICKPEQEAVWLALLLLTSRIEPKPRAPKHPLFANFAGLQCTWRQPSTTSA